MLPTSNLLTLKQGFGFVPSWEVMCVLRVLLGALEAGCEYSPSFWHRPYSSSRFWY